MCLRDRVHVCVLGLGCLLAAVPAWAQGPSDVAATLAMPISPGSIALLAEHPTEMAAQQRVKAALADARPETRAVAARLVFDTAMRGLIADVQAALAHETDPVAGAEEIRTWMTLAPTNATYATAVEAAARLGFPATEVVVDTFARLNAKELLTYVPQLASKVAPEHVVNAIMVVTASDHNARLQYVLKFAESWPLLDPLLLALHQDGDHPAPELLASLLRSSDVNKRQVGIWFLVLCMATDGRALTPEVKAALDPLIEASATQVDWEALGLELLSRAQGRKPRERRWLDLAKSPSPPGAHHPGDDRLIIQLNDTELGDLYQVTLENRDEGREYRLRTQAQLKQAKAPAKPDQPAWLTPNVGVRTVAPFVPGLWADLMHLTGCKPMPTFFIGADVAYRPDGRPARIAPGDSRLSAECERAAHILFSLTVAGEARPRPADFSDVQVLRMDERTIACADRAIAFTVPNTRRRYEHPAEAAGKFVRPKSIQEFPATYTEEARKRRLEGVVTVAGVLTPDGCFSDATVQTSPSPLLAGLALFSVLEWQFKPGTIDGNPVPVNMSVFVPFRLPR